MTPGRLIVVSNREPYVHEKSNKSIRCRMSVGGLVTALDPVMRRTKGTWVAWGSGNADAEMADGMGRLQVPDHDPQYTLRRIWLSPKEINEYYYGFSNRVIWPVCHLFQEKAQLLPEYWDTYQEVNRRFTRATLEEAGPGDHVWIQDVHFSLMPSALREAVPDLDIALFWHIPFPPWETFSCIPWRKEILEGMLGADLLGFHTSSYVSNFLNSVRKEIPEAQVSRSAIRYRDQVTRIRAFPIGIDYERFRQMGSKDDLQRRADQLRDRMNVKHIILGVDRLDYTKGILNRLLAFERFLDTNPRYLGKVSFIQVASPTRSAINEYKEMKRQIEETVGRVNGKFQRPQWTPVIYINRHIPGDELVMLYKVADVAMVTPIIDGMNLVAKEYVSINDNGILILSEFAGASEEMDAALIVNPYDLDSMVSALGRALSMTSEERARIMRPMRKMVEEHDVFWWLNTFMGEWGVDLDMADEQVDPEKVPDSILRH